MTAAYAGYVVVRLRKDVGQSVSFGYAHRVRLRRS